MNQPKALIVGMLERGGRALFLLRKEGHGTGIEMPCVYGSLSADPVSQLSEAFRKQAGIKAEAGRIVLEGRYEHEGNHIPCLVLEMRQLRKEEPDPASAYAGFEWLTLDEAKLRKHSKKGSWLSEPIMRVE
ncbi:MAG: hypothetical protein AB1529_00110 [Candidatus Micrarchaeota archaeon]